MTAPAKTPLAPFLALRTELGERRIGDGGPETCAALTTTLDGALRELATDLPDGAAVVALGGYGRGEQCLWSDIDVMMLHGGGDTERLVKGILYPLWDANLKVGHAVRTPQESAEAGKEDLETLTSLLSARLIAGDQDLFAELTAAVADMVRTHPLSPRLAARERERRQIDPYPTMSADVKEGRGGLRTHQGFWWERRRAELVGLPPDEPDAAEIEARARLLAIRNALHAAAGRSADRFELDLRETAARWLGVDVHSLAGDLVRTLHIGDRLADRRWPDLHVEHDTMVGLGRRVITAIRSRFSATSEPSGGGGVMDLAIRAVQRRDGAWFDEAEEDQIRQAPTASWSATERTAFVTLLSAGARGRSIFGRLEELGWVEREFPEWSAVATAPQLAPFHDHPVGAHLWRTADEMLHLINGGGETGTIADDVGSTEELLLAAFLHDIGKARGGNHEEVGADLAARFLRRIGFGPATIGVVARAVRLHLLLSHTATRRDVADRAVIEEVASLVGDLRTLQLLYLLTIADLKATGTTMWNDWRGSLLRRLYLRVAEAIATGSAPPATPDLEAVMDAVGPEIDRRTVEEHVAAMPAGYLDATPPREVAVHLNVAARLVGDALLAADPDDASRVVVAGTDRSGFLLAVCRAFTANGIGVMDARLRTRADGIAIDTFHVCDDRTGGAIDPARWERVARALDATLAGELDLRPRIRERVSAYRLGETDPSSIEVRAAAESRATVIEIRAKDRVGLLADVVEALHAEGLDIDLAKIDTMGGQARDVFHVRRVGVPIVVAADLAALRGRIQDRLRG